MSRGPRIALEDREDRVLVFRDLLDVEQLAEIIAASRHNWLELGELDPDSPTAAAPSTGVPLGLDAAMPVPDRDR